MKLSHLRSRPFFSALAVFMLTATLSGCVVPGATLAPYRAPEGSSTAPLMIRSKTEAGVGYSVILYTDAQNCSGAKSLGSGSGARHPETVALAVGKPVVLSIYFAKPGQRYCILRPSFTPVAGQRYLLSIQSQPGSCHVGMSNATDPDHIVKETSTSFKDARCNDAPDQGSEFKQAAPEAKESPDATKSQGPQLFNKNFDDDLKGLISKDK